MLVGASSPQRVEPAHILARPKRINSAFVAASILEDESIHEALLAREASRA